MLPNGTLSELYGRLLSYDIDRSDTHCLGGVSVFYGLIV